MMLATIEHPIPQAIPALVYNLRSSASSLSVMYSHLAHNPIANNITSGSRDGPYFGLHTYEPCSGNAILILRFARRFVRIPNNP